jgi:hypothetical protein
LWERETTPEHKHKRPPNQGGAGWHARHLAVGGGMGEGAATH